MPSILEKLANGEISVYNALKQDDPKHKQVSDVADSFEEKLLAILNGEEKAIFKKFVDARMDVECLLITNSFIYGYKLGVVMTAELLTICSFT